MLKNFNWTFIVAGIGLVVIVAGFFYPSEGLETLSNIFMIAVIFMVIRNSRKRKNESASKDSEKTSRNAEK